MKLRNIFSRFVMNRNKQEYAYMKERSLASYPDYFKR